MDDHFTLKSCLDESHKHSTDLCLLSCNIYLLFDWKYMRYNTETYSDGVFQIQFFNLHDVKAVKSRLEFQFVSNCWRKLESPQGLQSSVKALNRCYFENFLDELISINLHRSTGITQQFLYAWKVSIKKLHFFIVLAQQLALWEINNFKTW